MSSMKSDPARRRPDPLQGLPEPAIPVTPPTEPPRADPETPSEEGITAKIHIALERMGYRHGGLNE